MTNGELIELLKAYPPDVQVVVKGYEDGYDDPVPPQLQCIGHADYESDYCGTYHDGTAQSGWMAILINRPGR